MYDNKVRYDKTKTKRPEQDKANSKKRVQEKAKETDRDSETHLLTFRNLIVTNIQKP